MPSELVKQIPITDRLASLVAGEDSLTLGQIAGILHNEYPSIGDAEMIEQIMRNTPTCDSLYPRVKDFITTARRLGHYVAIWT